MEIKKSLKRLFIVLVVLFLVLGGIFIVERKTIFQEGNPVAMFVAVLKLNFSNKDFVKVSGEKMVYLMKTKNLTAGQGALLKSLNCVERDQLGAKHFFDCKNGTKGFALMRLFTRYYMVWQVVIENEF
jgi:hypothetical protein